MLVVLIVVICAVVVLGAGFGTFTALSRGRTKRSLERGPGAGTRPALKAPPSRPEAPPRPVPPPRPEAPAEAEAGAGPEAEAPPEAGAGPEAEAPPETGTEVEVEVEVEVEALAAADAEAGPEVELPAEPAIELEESVEVLERPRFRDRLGRARSLLADQLAGLRRRGRLDQQSWDELEEALILADVGITTTELLLKDLKETARRDSFSTSDQLVGALREELVSRLEGSASFIWRATARRPSGSS